MNIESILGIILIVIIFLTAIYNDKKNKELRQLKENNSNFKEKIEVQMGGTYSKKGLKNRKLFLLVLILIFIFIALFIYISSSNGIDYKTISNITLIIFVGLIILYFIVIKLKKNNEETFIKNYISTRYDEFEFKKMNKKELISGMSFNIGSIRKNYVSTIKILKYKCILNEYYIEKYTIHPDFDDGYDHGFYEKISRKIEYLYDISQYSKELLVSYLQREDIQKIIKELSEIKYIDVEIKDNYLVVTKQTVLKIDDLSIIERDLEDIELFYNKLVKPLNSKIDF